MQYCCMGPCASIIGKYPSQIAKPVIKDHLWTSVCFPFLVWFRLSNCKILIAHMDVIVMSLIYHHTYSIALSTLQNIYYYVNTLYCEQLWHLPIISSKYSTQLGTEISLWCYLNSRIFLCVYHMHLATTWI